MNENIVKDPVDPVDPVDEVPVEVVPPKKRKASRKRKSKGGATKESGDQNYVDLVNAQRVEQLRNALFNFKPEESEPGMTEDVIDEIELRNKQAKRKLASRFKPITEADILDVKPKGQGVVQDKVGIVTNDGQKYYI